MAETKISGIYTIRCILNNHRYIGYSVDTIRRWRDHRRELRGNRHANSYLQNAWNLHKEENFVFEIIEKIDRSNEERMMFLETYFIVYYNSHVRDGCGYNMSYGGEGQLGQNGENGYWYGKKRDPETIEKIIETKRLYPSEMPKGEDHWNYGRVWSDEIIQKRSDRLKGHPFWGGFTGKKHSNKTKQDIGDKSRGRIASEETRKKQSDAKKGTKGNRRAFEEDEVLEILDLLKQGISGMEIARRKGVHKSVIYDIKDNKTYRWVKREGGGSDELWQTMT